MENLKLTLTTYKRKPLIKYAHSQDEVAINYPVFATETIKTFVKF